MVSSSRCNERSMSASVHLEGRRYRRHSQPAQQTLRAMAAGLQPHLIEAQHVIWPPHTGRVTDLADRIDHALELARQLAKYAAHYAARTVDPRSGQRAVGTSAHCDMVVHVHQSPLEALR